MISCILLSAGLSERFGSPKALAPLTDNTVTIEYLQQTLADSLVSEVVIVLGSAAEDIRPYVLNHKKIKVVYNKDYIFGQTSSFKAGLKAASPNARAFMLLPVDYPLIKKATINALCNYEEKNKPLILIPAYKTQKGHPPVFSFSVLPELLLLDNNVGINTVIHQHAKEVRLLATDDPGVTATFNTPEEFTKLIELVKK